MGWFSSRLPAACSLAY